MRKIIKLFGIGGNFKSTLINHAEEKGYTVIPECHREFSEKVGWYAESTTVASGSVVKELITREIMKMNPERVITDRSIIDQFIINKLITDGVLGNLKGADNEWMTIEEGMKREEEAYPSGYDLVNILLTTTDRKFIEFMMTESIGNYCPRQYTYKDLDTYLRAQDYYVKVITDKFDGLTIIEHNNVDGIDYYVQELKSSFNRYL